MSENTQSETRPRKRLDPLAGLASAQSPQASPQAPPPVDSDTGRNDQPPRSLEAPTPPRALKSEELLLQASQVAEHLSSQFNELGRREQALISQLNEIDQERRNVRLWVQQFEDDVRERDTAVRAAEDQLEQRIAKVAETEKALEVRRAELDLERDNLETERRNLREELQAELQNERIALHDAQTAAAELREQLVLETEAQRETAAEALSDLQLRFDQEHEELQHRFKQQTTAWQVEKQHQIDELAKERKLHEEAARRTQEELEKLREQTTQELDAARAEAEREIAESQAAHAEKLEAERREKLAELETARAEFETHRNTESAQLKQERIVFENRLRFQQEHLAKTRHELEEAQVAFRVEAQQKQTRFEQWNTLLRLRLNQLDHYRTLLEERELSIQRTQEMTLDSRRSVESAIGEDRRRLQNERKTWEEERAAQRAELRRQQDVLGLHAENMEARRTRLDQLRGELEETHRDTLEMRMAVEEACAQLAGTAGAEASQQRIEAARAALSEHYSRLREALLREQQEFASQKQEFEQQRNEFREERQTLTEWIAERDERLRLREEQLGSESETIDTRETEWRAARDHWLQEKLEAETVIRGLLQQLTTANHPNVSGS